jgi:glycolate oxidase iron-sulfur subunit
LQKNGCEVWIPRNQVCCGALHYHSAQEEPAQQLAQVNCEVFSASQVDAVIVNAAGCGAMLKDYEHLMSNPAFSRDAQRSAQSTNAEAAQRFAAKVRDIS